MKSWTHISENSLSNKIIITIKWPRWSYVKLAFLDESLLNFLSKASKYIYLWILAIPRT